MSESHTPARQEYIAKTPKLGTIKWYEFQIKSVESQIASIDFDYNKILELTKGLSSLKKDLVELKRIRKKNITLFCTLLSLVTLGTLSTVRQIKLASDCSNYKCVYVEGNVIEFFESKQLPLFIQNDFALLEAYFMIPKESRPEVIEQINNLPSPETSIKLVYTILDENRTITK